MKRTAAYVGETGPDGGYHVAMNTLSTEEVERLKRKWEALATGPVPRIFGICEIGPEIIWTGAKHRFRYSVPSRDQTYTPTVQRIDWLAELRDTKRQALIGAAILGLLVLTFVAGCLRLAGVL